MEYRRSGRPIAVSFRELLRSPGADERYTHGLHPYPAKLFVNIPAFILSSRELCRPGATVLDPFCGSGTVLLEAILAGRDSLGADSNPLARLISQTKTTPVDPHRLRRIAAAFPARLPKTAPVDVPNVLNLEYWFHPRVSRDLHRILTAIERIKSEDVRAFFTVAFSACLKDASFADPRLSVPVRLRVDQYPKGHWLYAKTVDRLRKLRHLDVVRLFLERLHRNIAMMSLLKEHPRRGEVVGICDDARALSLPSGSKTYSVPDQSVDLVITSPPYVGAQKYVRASSLSLTWLGLCGPKQLRQLEDKNIGREHHAKTSYASLRPTGIPAADRLLKEVRRDNPLRAHIASTYLSEMAESLGEMSRVTKSGGHLVMVSGEGTVCGRGFKTPSYLAELAHRCGFSTRLALMDPIRSRALMTKRHRTAGIIPTEYVQIFRKE
jgi:hypothetical protein